MQYNFPTQIQPFMGAAGTGEMITVTNTANAKTWADELAARCPSVFVWNSSSTIPAYMRTSKGVSAALTTDQIIPPGAFFVLNKGDHTNFSLITASSTADVYVIVGQGQ